MESDNVGQASLCRETVECDPVKEEPKWAESNVNEAAETEDSYTNHKVKDEFIVVFLPPQPDVAFSMPNALSTTEEGPYRPKPAGEADAAAECMHTCHGDASHCISTTKQQRTLKTSFVKDDQHPVKDQHTNKSLHMSLNPLIV
ncbi:hypothetical protein MSG28_014706 [Choristoneura fumiferana]|uniref:Uncharacterized protein n=1 Tax=Choristoneura fumiferana TaxID=7141 RepID=A0ACC0JSV1_CHOFU|nr:hypothetical protein MSG28_014706 [Choristoneura fumiferana]